MISDVSETTKKKKLLIIKTGAAGDVVRTTTLLHAFKMWDIDWITAPENSELLRNNLLSNVLTDPASIDPEKTYDLVINLEDDERYISRISRRLRYTRIFGSFIDESGHLSYSPDSAEWFDIGLVSRHGLEKANVLKLENRRSYQDIIFSCLGFKFKGERYVIPEHAPESDLRGDIAISPKAGKRWPIKDWFYFDKLIEALSRDYKVTVLPTRQTLLQHISDVKHHKLLISPDSLPMHLAMGLGVQCIAIFTCTSPWEIHDYGLLTKIISPKLSNYWYSRTYHEDAVTAVSFHEVYSLVLQTLETINIKRAS